MVWQKYLPHNSKPLDEDIIATNVLLSYEQYFWEVDVGGISVTPNKINKKSPFC